MEEQEVTSFLARRQNSSRLWKVSELGNEELVSVTRFTYRTSPIFRQAESKELYSGHNVYSEPGLHRQPGRASVWIRGFELYCNALERNKLI